MIPTPIRYQQKHIPYINPRVYIPISYKTNILHISESRTTYKVFLSSAHIIFIVVYHDSDWYIITFIQTWQWETLINGGFHWRIIELIGASTFLDAFPKKNIHLVPGCSTNTINKPTHWYFITYLLDDIIFLTVYT